MNRVRSRPASPRGPRTPGGASANPQHPVGYSVVLDAGVWVSSMAAMAAVNGESLIYGVIAGVIAGSLQISLGALSKLYQRRWQLASFEEVIAISGVVAVTSVILALIQSVFAGGVATAISPMVPLVALIAMVGLRALGRWRRKRLFVDQPVDEQELATEPSAGPDTTAGTELGPDDVAAIGSYLRGARVLVTGAGGTIGSELCRQISKYDPAELILVDRDEPSLQATQSTIEAGLTDLDTTDDDMVSLVFADIRSVPSVNALFSQKVPDVVFHAAALIHLTTLERNPEEGWETNVLGTNNVLRAAATHGVAHFVNVSTDRAGDPQTVLGYTKRIAERLTSWYAHRTRGDWLSVRLGNVVGQAGPVASASSEANRYGVTPEAVCQLVLRAGAGDARGEALVLDVTEQLRLFDLDDRSDGEPLLSLDPTTEVDLRGSTPVLSHVYVPALRPTKLGLFDSSSIEAATRSLQNLSATTTETIHLEA